MAIRYTLHQWENGDAHLDVVTLAPTGKMRVTDRQGFQLVRNPDGGYDVHESSRYDVPVATVDCLPEALEWAMGLPEPKGD